MSTAKLRLTGPEWGHSINWKTRLSDLLDWEPDPGTPGRYTRDGYEAFVLDELESEPDSEPDRYHREWAAERVTELVKLRLTGENWGYHRGSIVNAEPSWDKVYTIVEPGHRYDDFNVLTEGDENYGGGWDGELVADITTFEVPDKPDEAPVGVASQVEPDAIDPDHYQFPGNVQVIDISEHLSGNGAQVVQYVARATRQDGKIKGDPLEDLRKAAWFLNREIQRLEAGE